MTPAEVVLFFGLLIIAAPFFLYHFGPGLYTKHRRRAFCNDMMESVGIDPRKHNITLVDAPKDRRRDKNIAVYRLSNADGTSWLQWKDHRLVATDQNTIVLIATSLQDAGLTVTGV